MKNQLLKRSSSNYFDSGNSNDSTTTKFTTEFSSCNSKRYFSPVISLKNTYTFLSPLIKSNKELIKKKKIKKPNSKSIIELSNKLKKKLKIFSQETFLSKYVSPNKYDNLNTFQLLSKIKYDIKDKIKNNIKKSKRRNYSLTESINSLNNNLHIKNQKYIKSQNNKQNFYNLTEQLRQKKIFNDVLNENIKEEIKLNLEENNKIEELIFKVRNSTNDRKNLYNQLNIILNKDKEKCLYLSKEINQLIEDKKYLSSSLLDKIKKIKKLKEILYQKQLKTEQIDSHLKSIIDNFEK